jgi:hypothetical protein
MIWYGLINFVTWFCFFDFFPSFTLLNFLDWYYPCFHDPFSQILVSRGLVFFAYYLFQNFLKFLNFKLKPIDFRWTDKTEPDHFCQFSWKPTSSRRYLSPCDPRPAKSSCLIMRYKLRPKKTSFLGLVKSNFDQWFL